MRVLLTHQIVSETLPEPFCFETYEQIQVQGKIVDAEELEFFFMGSWFHHQYECPQNIGKDSPLTQAKIEHAPSAAAAGSEDCRDQRPLMPNGRWLMDTGCGHDLINDRLAAGLNVRTLTK